MAERRMFTKKITDDDHFQNLSSSAQALYFHLSMAADDDGFCNQVNSSMFKAHASVQDLEALLTARYLYQFDSGVIVIKHWRMANALRKDRYTPTEFQRELSQLRVKPNGVYTEITEDGCQLVANTATSGCQMVASGKDRLGKDALSKVSAESIESSSIVGNKEDAALSEIFQAFEANIGSVSPSEYDLIKDWARLYDKDLVIEAIKEAAIRKKKNGRYIDTTLRRCPSDGVYTAADFRARIDERAQQNAATGKTRRNPAQAEQRTSKTESFMADMQAIYQEFEGGGSNDGAGHGANHGAVARELAERNPIPGHG